MHEQYTVSKYLFVDVFENDTNTKRYSDKC